MKRWILTAICILTMLSALAQNESINMDTFWEYRNNLFRAQKANDKDEVKRLESLYSAKYGRKEVEKRAKNGDVEACAYLAGYLQTDYFKKKNITNLKKVVSAYRQVIKKCESSSRDAEVLYSYANFLDRIDAKDLSETEELSNIQKKWDRDAGKYLVRKYSWDELRKQKYSNIGWYISRSADKGYALSAYIRARIPLEKDTPPFDASIILQSMWNESYVKRIYEYKYMGREMSKFSIRNTEVVRYYTMAASSGNPTYQMEFAEYLLLTMCQGTFGIWNSIPGNGPFVRKDDYSDKYRINYNRESGYRHSFRCVFDGSYVIEDDIPLDDIEEQLTYWYQQAANQDYTPAMVNYAFCIYYMMQPYADSIHYADAEKWLKKAAMNGDKLAIYNLSVIMSTKNERKQQDAFDWAKRGADSGDVKCMHLLGRYYYHGIGVSINKIKALEWFRKAADNGSKGAAYMAGKLYADKSVGNNMPLAVKYYNMADEIQEAYSCLAECYSKGLGVTMDKQKARDYQKKLEWYVVSYDKFSPGLCFYMCDEIEGCIRDKGGLYILKQ